MRSEEEVVMPDVIDDVAEVDEVDVMEEVNDEPNAIDQDTAEDVEQDMVEETMGGLLGGGDSI